MRWEVFCLPAWRFRARFWEIMAVPLFFSYYASHIFCCMMTIDECILNICSLKYILYLLFT